MYLNTFQWLWLVIFLRFNLMYLNTFQWLWLVVFWGSTWFTWTHFNDCGLSFFWGSTWCTLVAFCFPGWQFIVNLNSANWFAFFFSEAADFYDVPLLQTMSHSWLFWYFRKLALSNYPDVFSWSWTPSHNHGIQITVTLLKQLLFCVVLAGDFITAINAFDKKSFVIIFH